MDTATNVWMSADDDQAQATVPGAASPVVELTPKAAQACPDPGPDALVTRIHGSISRIMLHFYILSYIILHYLIFS